MGTMVLEKTAEDIKKQLQNLDIKTVELLAKDHSKAVDYIKIGREAIQGSELTDEEIESLASEMQAVAKMVFQDKNES